MKLKVPPLSLNYMVIKNRNTLAMLKAANIRLLLPTGVTPSLVGAEEASATLVVIVLVIGAIVVPGTVEAGFVVPASTVLPLMILGAMVCAGMVDGAMVVPGIVVV